MTKKIELLSKIYENKSSAIGSDIDKINDSIIKIGLELELERKK